MLKDKGPILVILAGIFLSIVGYNNLSLPLYTSDFTPESYYRGKNEQQVLDPKEYYQKLHGLSVDTSSDTKCNPTLVQAKNQTPLGSNGVFFIDKEMKGIEGDLVDSIGIDGSGLFNDGDVIVMPKNDTEFINSNIEVGTETTNIEFYLGTRIIVKFKDVKSWWCHNHNPDITTHTVKVGCSTKGDSMYSSVSAGTIIGTAKSSTVMEVYAIPDSVWGDGTKCSNRTKGVELKQIRADSYFKDGTLSFI